jgi:hypothetical protein
VLKKINHRKYKIQKFRRKQNTKKIIYVVGDEIKSITYKNWVWEFFGHNWILNLRRNWDNYLIWFNLAKMKEIWSSRMSSKQIVILKIN